MNEELKNLRFSFFGTSEFSVIVLEELAKAGLKPKLVITPPDSPQGRKLLLTPPPAKVWAEQNNIPVYQPVSLKSEEVYNFLSKNEFDVFIVVVYGKLIPNNILDIPKYKTLNIHPSLLPKLRGPSPIKTAILNETETGVTIIVLDQEMDHGPIVVQKKLIPNVWPKGVIELDKELAILGAELLIKTLPDYINGKIVPQEQNHQLATFTKKVEKEDAFLNLSDSVEVNLRKVKAYEDWPRAYFFYEKNGNKIRMIVTDAKIEDGEFVIKKVIPEGKREMNYEDFLLGH